jgi:two-component system cell cycle sensor histidine kinase/response regulator CckA
MEALGTLAGGVAHDFNNLLQIIFGYADLIMMRVDRKSANYRGIRAIREAARRGSDLVKQVLTFSRRVETNPRPLDLNHEVKKASQLLGRTIPKMINIELTLAEDLKTIYADPVQIEQIILNLAVNAKDAMPEGGKLTLATESISLDEKYCRKCPEINPGEYVCLRISDTGHGMAPEILDHIFEPFFTTKKPGEGTGLGLSTVFGLVKMHSGHISCHSKLQTGTVFRIYFPAIEQRVPWDVEATSEMPPFGTETVLLIDDEEMVRNWGKELLTHAGYTVLSASNGREGLELYRQRKSEISLVILDLIMPQMGGKQCLDALLQVDPDLKAIVASGFPIDQKTKELLDEHAKGVITKPFHAKELLRLVRLVLDAG